MLRVAVDSLEPNLELAKDIFSNDGRLCLATGAVLSAKNIEKLKAMNIEFVFLKNPIVELPHIDEVEKQETRQKVISVVKNSICKLRNNKALELSLGQKELVFEAIDSIIRKRDVILFLSQIERHSDDIIAHSFNVAILSIITALGMNLFCKEDLKTIFLGALLHDVGKIAMTSQSTTSKEVRILQEEELPAEHAIIGFDMLRKKSNIPLLAAHIALQHHERFDGKGYPRQLGGDDMVLMAKIVCVANEYDNFITDRGCKKSMRIDQAYEKIASESGFSFDPEVVSVFLSRIALYPIGTIVKLTNGQFGVVIETTSKLQHRPKLRILIDEKGVFLEKHFEIDLSSSHYLTLFVQRVVDDDEALQLMRNKVAIY